MSKKPLVSQILFIFSLLNELVFLFLLILNPVGWQNRTFFPIKYSPKYTEYTFLYRMLFKSDVYAFFVCSSWNKFGFLKDPPLKCSFENRINDSTMQFSFINDAKHGQNWAVFFLFFKSGCIKDIEKARKICSSFDGTSLQTKWLNSN